MTRRFYVSPQQAGKKRIAFTGTDARHMTRVLRLKPGDHVELFDGAGGDYDAKIDSLTPNSVALTILRSKPGSRESPVHITVAQGILKDKKNDALIRPLTELGVAEWLPYISCRSVPVPDARRMDARQRRWEKIAVESLKQCRRSRAMKIRHTASYEDLLAIAEPYNLKIVFWEEETRPLSSQKITGIQSNVCPHIFILLGPEGGLSRDEVAQAVDSGFVSAALGPRILRAETAAIAASTLIQFLFGDLGKIT